jgi:hypothetical protein
LARRVLALIAVCAAAPSMAGGADTLAWRLSYQEADMILAFGEEATDNAGIVMKCHPETGIVYLTAPVETGANELRLASGRYSQAYPAKVEETDFGRLASAEAAVYDAPIKAFGKTGKIRVGSAAMNAETGAERKVIRQFVDLCVEVAD